MNGHMNEADSPQQRGVHSHSRHRSCLQRGTLGVAYGDLGDGRHLPGVLGWTSLGQGTVKGKSWGSVPMGYAGWGCRIGDGQGVSLAPERMLLACPHLPQPGLSQLDHPVCVPRGVGAQARLPSDWVFEQGLRPRRDPGWEFRDEVHGAGWPSCVS